MNILTHNLLPVISLVANFCFLKHKQATPISENVLFLVCLNYYVQSSSIRKFILFLIERFLQFFVERAYLFTIFLMRWWAFLYDCIYKELLVGECI